MRLPIDNFKIPLVDSEEALSAHIFHCITTLLPQKDVIPKPRASSFSVRLANFLIDAATDPKTEVVDWKKACSSGTWHLRRMSGFGGSEIGTIVAYSRGENGDFTTARNIICGKLAIALPDEETYHMARGTRAELWLRRMYHEMVGGQSDEAALKKLSSFRPDGAYYWQIGSPDDIVTVNGKNHMPDYKAPTIASLTDTREQGVSFGYKCQLHHYWMLAFQAGLVTKDSPLPIFLAPFDMDNFQMLRMPLPIEREVIADIRKVGTQMWNDFVMKGVLPPKLEFQVNPLPERDLQAEVQSWVTSKLIGETLIKDSKTLIERIAFLNSLNAPKSPGAVQIGPVNVKVDRVYDEEKLVALMEQFDLDPKNFLDKKDVKKAAFDPKQGEVILKKLLDIISNPAMEGETPDQKDQRVLAEVHNVALGGMPVKAKLDTKAAVDAIIAAGGDPEVCATYETDVRVSRKAADAVCVADMNKLAGNVSEYIGGDIRKMFGQFVPGWETPDDDEDLTAEPLALPDPVAAEPLRLESLVEGSPVSP